MIFESPLWLLGLLVLPAITVLELWLTRLDRDRTARWLARPLWARVLRRPAERWRFVRLACLLLGAAGVVLALARPQWGIVREKVEREGVDIVVLLDTSGSMATQDVAPSRFFIARQAVGSLVARLEGDRFGLVAFEGEAYPLVPLTLDADAIGLFLETIEPGIVPSAGSSIGAGLAKGLDLFVDQSRHHKVMVLISDGEDLGGEVSEAVRRAKEAGVVVHAVAVGTEAGQPVPDFDAEGRQTGFKHDESGTTVISRLDLPALEAIARGTGGQVFRITPNDPSLSSLAAAIEGMEQKSLFREYSYRRKERFQVPLAVGLIAIAIGLMVPPPPLRRARAGLTLGVALLLALGLGTRADAQAPGSSPAPEPKASSPAQGDPAAVTPAPQVKKTPAARMQDELLLRPRRLTSKAKKQYAEGNHPQALEDFERAARTRPEDPRTRFNVADGLYKNGKFDEAATLFQSLGQDRASGLAGPSLYNRGNTLYQKQDYRGAIDSYRDALRRTPGDLDTRKNLEMALRALEAQKEQQKQDSKNQNKDQNKDQKSQDQQQQQQQQQQKQQQQQQQQQQQTPEQRENQRFQDDAGMPKDRAMQLLDALQRNEKDEQKKLLQAQRAKRRGGKDW